MMVGMTVEYYHKKEFVLRYKLKQAHEKIEKEILERIKNEETVKSLLVEKEFILKEVHHRIKNNMTTIIALLNLQTGTVKDISAVTAIKEAESRVRSMMVLYDKLYLSENFNHLSVKDYLSSLIDEIIMNFPNRGSVAVIKNIDDFILDSKSLFSVGIIINELLTNIMKYAFQGKEGGVITASASLMDKNVQLVIQDDGIGIPEWVDFENSNGFGLMLIKMLTHQLSGNIRIERNNGTGFILEFRANPGAGYILKAAV
jgi:two-component sensor histidine kinase